MNDFETKTQLPILVHYFLVDKSIPNNFEVKPHGNARSDIPFHPSSKSLISEVKQEVANRNANVGQIYRKIIDRKENEVVSTPRNKRQLYNYKYCNEAYQRKPVDEVAEVLKMLVENRHNEENKFLRRVEISSYPIIVLYNQQQMLDILRYTCSDAGIYTPLCLDTTFDVGDFFLTTTTFCELSLRKITTKKAPTFIGPAIIHCTKDRDSYATLLFEIKKIAE